MTGVRGQVVCFGEMLLRLSPPAPEALFQTPDLQAHFGGAEANVAVALARLGYPSAMVSRLPDDMIGAAALETLRRHGVDTGGIGRAPGRLGLYYLAPGAGPRAASVVYDRAGSSFALARPDDFDWPRLLAGAAWLHLSGITLALSETCAVIAADAVRAAKAQGVRIAFDGNHRARLWEARGCEPAPILCGIVEQADLFFGNHRDISLLLGRTLPGDTPAARRGAAEAAFARFPGLQWIASTSRTIEDAGHHRLAARIDGRETFAETEATSMRGIIDRIGSGDAFAAGVLSAIDQGPERASRTGLALAVLKHFTPGDMSLAGPDEVAAFERGERDVQR